MVPVGASTPIHPPASPHSVRTSHSRGTACFVAGLVVVAGVATRVSAQSARTIPVKTLGPITAVAKDTVGPVLAVRELSNRSVLVNDLAGRRVLLFDPPLGTAKVVIDTVGGTEPDAPFKVPQPSAVLIRYFGDSTLYPFRLSQSLLVLDEKGKVARVMSLPRQSDIATVGAGGEAGTPGIDSKGRLVYHGVYRPRPPVIDSARPWQPPIPVQVDSSPIVRADFDTRKIDTLAALKLNLGAPFKNLEVDDKGNVIMHMYVNLSGVDDQWAYLSDGTIAVLSVHDYHIEWTDPDGTHRSSPKMPFDWRRLTDVDKQRMMDSVRPMLEERNNVTPRTMNTPMGPRTARQRFEFLPPERFGDYEQPVQTGAVKADLDAHLWILPRTSLGAKGGLLYDVINRKGDIEYRVQFPPGYALAGFGTGGVLYVVRVDGRKAILERTSVKQ